MRRLILALMSLPALAACQNFPELDVSEARFDASTPYPDLVPVSELLDAPEATITDEVEDELTNRRDDLTATPQAPSTADSDPAKDPLQNRLDALREKRDAEADNDPIIDDALRKRLETGITAPTLPE